MTTGTFTPEELHERFIRTRKAITSLILFAIVMFFAGLTSAYVVSMSGGYWVDIAMPQAFWISTVAIVISSVLAQLALWSAAKGRNSAVMPLLLGALLLGAVFTWSQFQGWKELVAKGDFPVGKVLDNKGVYGTDYTIQYQGATLVLQEGYFYHPNDVEYSHPLNAELGEQKNTSSSFFYALTGAHLGHLAFGLLSLIVMIFMAKQGRYSPEDHVGLWSGVIYWHFLGGLWLYLLLFLVFVH